MQTSEILLNVMAAVSSELELNQLLRTIVVKTSESMQADRCTLFLIDKKTGELFSRIAQGEDVKEIRIPGNAGIAGHVATTGETVNIPDCYQDPRFNPEIDRKTGYHTRNMLCMPIRDEKRQIIGVLQVLNRKGGPFTEEDERLLDALGSQMAVALQNSQLFEEVLFMRNYNDGILRSIATSVLTVDPEGTIAFTNTAGLNLMYDLENLEVGQHFSRFLGEEHNAELVGGVAAVQAGAPSFTAYDLRYKKANGDTLNINVHVFPLRDSKNKPLGSVVVADDITQEQRLMSTLCRYVTRSVAEKVLEQRDEMRLGGKRSRVAVLFSDIRNFTTMSERISAEEVVGLLNEYFSAMIVPIFHHEGTLDKYIGDAIMAVFGAPVAHDNDAERAVRAAMEMRHALHRFNEARSRRGLPPIETGIGITLGEAVSGNIGGEQRMDYTVIGDTVNLASRLEGLTKDFETKIIVNEDVYQEIKDIIPAVDLGNVQVKGKGEAVRIFGIPDLDEQRRHERREADFEVAYEFGGREMVTAGTDLGRNGLSFYADEPLPMDMPLLLKLRFPGGDWQMVRCGVRSFRPGVIGVCFLDLEAHERLLQAQAVGATAAGS
jgi:adenylate cyclase